MATTYRDAAIEDIMGTIEEAMAEVINYWGCLPAPMKDAIEDFRGKLGATIDSVDLVKRALDREIHEGRGEGPP
jgi:hypothetical protein